ncbi:hypothetical protein BROUX41_004166 [Berkeleyomyces rouxiae]|uniref:uncharacterized protein n=1 Tax=Berkeleyomyces rouxiae TaxID=2035830 RepID=UPI003B8280C0
METPTKRRALSVLDANVNASPRSPVKSLKTPASDIRKRPFDNIPSLPTPSKRPCYHKTPTTSPGLQPSPILSKFSLRDSEIDLPPPSPAMGLGMTSFDCSPDASRAFMTACASSPTVALPRPRSRTMSRQETRQKADALRLRLGLANYKLRTGQADVPLDKLQMRPCRSLRHSISFPSSTARAAPTFSAMAATARKALGHMTTTSTSAMMSSSPVQPSPLRERQQRVAAATTTATAIDASAASSPQVQLPTPMPSQEEHHDRQLLPRTQQQQPRVQPPNIELTGDETESEPEMDADEPDNAGDETETEPDPVVTPRKQTSGCSTAEDDSGAATGLLFLARSA